MKNNQGLSPVIAVIIMIAIIAMLAATVYVWVTGFHYETPEERCEGNPRCIAIVCYEKHRDEEGWERCMEENGVEIGGNESE